MVDDHGLIAQMLATALHDRGADVTVVAPQAVETMIDEMVAAAPDLAVVDLDLGAGLGAVDLLPSLKDAGIPCLVVTGVTDRVRRAECLAAGAIGVVSKGGSFEELVAVLDRAVDGQPVLSAAEREEQLALLRAHRQDHERRLRPFGELTRREAEVLAGLMHGHSVDELAAAGSVSVATVRSQVQAILRKLGVSSQVAAIARAMEAGWTPPTR